MTSGNRVTSLFPQDKEPHKYVIGKSKVLAGRFHCMDLAGSCRFCGAIMPSPDQDCTKNNGSMWHVVSRGARYFVYRKECLDEKGESYYLYLYIDSKR